MLLDISAGSIFAAVIPPRLRSRVGCVHVRQLRHPRARPWAASSGPAPGPAARAVDRDCRRPSRRALPPLRRRCCGCASCPSRTRSRRRPTEGAPRRTGAGLRSPRWAPSARTTPRGLVRGRCGRLRASAARVSDDAVRWLAGQVPVDVVDVGAGTGKLTRSLVAHGHRVTAVEPLEAMLEQLRAAAPSATAVVGSAESIPLPDGSADVVTAAQAFHWFDQPVALREIARPAPWRPGSRSSGTHATTGGVGCGVHRHDRRSKRVSRRWCPRCDREHRRERSVRAGRACHVRPRADARAVRARRARPFP